MSITNAEIKARCTSPENIRQILRSKNARYIGTDTQIDTYFAVPSGRLKLRQGKIENALIYYNRSDQAASKISEVELFKTANAPGLLRVLEAALPKLIVVEKMREIYFIENVKFHLDQVKGLGSFVEIEAIDQDGEIDVEELHAQCAYYRELLGIQDEALERSSYSDMLIDQSRTS